MRVTLHVVVTTAAAIAVCAVSLAAEPRRQRGDTQPRNPPYLAQFPSVDRVRAELKGADAMDSAARQMGAFWQLQEIMKELSGFRFVRNQLTPDEKQLLGRYSAAYQAASQPYASYPDKPKWYQMHAFYETDDRFRNELFTRFLSPALLAEYTKTKGDTRAAVQQSARQRATVLAPTPAPPAPALPPPSSAPPRTLTTARTADVPPAPPRPSGPKNSTISLRGASLETYYVLDDGFEVALRRMGFHSQQLLGQQLPLLNSFEVVRRWKAQADSPLFKLLGDFAGAGGNIFDADFDEQYALGMKALTDHTVATIKTDASGGGTSPMIPSGTYYVYGTSEDFVKTGAQGTITGNTVTLSDTGFNAVTIWNVKISAKPGANVVTLTRDNAAFDPFSKP
jgi:hypothetical protein